MCGIVGAVSQRNIVPILVEGLKRLEYRGYDSCGVAVHQDGGLKRARSTSRVAELQAQADQDEDGKGQGTVETLEPGHDALQQRGSFEYNRHGRIIPPMRDRQMRHPA